MAGLAGLSGRLLHVSAEPSQPPPQAQPPPQYSPDRKFYWDGTRWVPVPPKSFLSSLGGCFAIGCAGLLALAVVGAIAAQVSVYVRLATAS